MAIGQRLAYFIKNHISIKDKDFAEQIGFSKQTLSNLLNDRNQVSIDKLIKIALAYPMLNIRWLLTGEGAMLGDAGGIASAIHTPQRVEHEKIALLEQLLEEKERTIKTQAALINALGG